MIKPTLLNAIDILSSVKRNLLVAENLQFPLRDMPDLSYEVGDVISVLRSDDMGDHHIINLSIYYTDEVEEIVLSNFPLYRVNSDKSLSLAFDEDLFVHDLHSQLKHQGVSYNSQTHDMDELRDFANVERDKLEVIKTTAMLIKLTPDSYNAMRYLNKKKVPFSINRIKKNQKP